MVADLLLAFGLIGLLAVLVWYPALRQRAARAEVHLHAVRRRRQLDQLRTEMHLRGLQMRLELWDELGDSGGRR